MFLSLFDQVFLKSAWGNFFASDTPCRARSRRCNVLSQQIRQENLKNIVADARGGVAVPLDETTIHHIPTRLRWNLEMVECGRLVNNLERSQILYPSPEALMKHITTPARRTMTSANQNAQIAVVVKSTWNNVFLHCARPEETKAQTKCIARRTQATMAIRKKRLRSCAITANWWIRALPNCGVKHLATKSFYIFKNEHIYEQLHF